ncbi:MAG TPA: YraN family protein [Saprospiraceae bacterium]|nr:YraN family protein [Saprospiraceae bacterium]HMQ84240.1 YraN family protein [Saprospiraceae bacterium]
MGQHQELGKWGEKLAEEYLEQKGYRVLANNWKYQRAEIDLIAKKEDVLVFVEVKTRSNSTFGAPEEFLSPAQEVRIISAASDYMEKHPHEGEIRFDIIAIKYNSEYDFHLHHYEDAFFPGLE